MSLTWWFLSKVVLAEWNETINRPSKKNAIYGVNETDLDWMESNHCCFKGGFFRNSISETVVFGSIYSDEFLKCSGISYLMIRNNSCLKWRAVLGLFFSTFFSFLLSKAVYSEILSRKVLVVNRCRIL